MILCDEMAHAEISRGLGKKSYVIAFVHMLRSGFVSFFFFFTFFTFVRKYLMFEKTGI